MIRYHMSQVFIFNTKEFDDATNYYPTLPLLHSVRKILIADEGERGFVILGKFLVFEYESKPRRGFESQILISLDKRKMILFESSKI